MYFAMNIARHILIFALGVTASWAHGGDAVAFDYSTGFGGIYYSSTPAGGADYNEALDARGPALTMAKRNGAKAPIVIHQSNDTGYFCLAVGFNAAGRFVACVGEGGSAVEAKSDAFRGLRAYGATSKPDVIHEYFSFGRESKLSKPGK